MSWKLAELRWRHDIGLYESRWAKESSALPVERKRAIEAFEKRGRRSRSLSASRGVAKSNLAIEKDASLGEPVMAASSAFRSSVEAITHERLPAQRAPGPQQSSFFLVPLLQTRSNCSTDQLALEGGFRRDDLLISHPTARCHSSSAFSRNSSEVLSPSPDRAQHLEGDSNETCK